MIEPKHSRSRKRVIVAVGYVLSIVFLFLFLRDMDWPSLEDEFARVDLRILALALVVDFFAFIFMSLRAQILFKAFHSFRFGEMLRASLIAYSGNNVLPARAGEFMRGAFLMPRGALSMPAVAGVVTVEWLMDAGAVVMLAMAALPFSMGRPGMAFYLLAGSVVAASSVIVVVSRHPEGARRVIRVAVGRTGPRLSGTITPFLDRFFEGIRGLGKSRTLVAAGILTTMNWLLTATSIFIWIRACGIDLAWYQSLFVLASIAAGNAVPSSPGNIGTFHYFVRSALEVLGVASAAAGTVAIVGYFTKVPFTVVGLLLGLRSVSKRRRGLPAKALDVAPLAFARYFHSALSATGDYEARN